MAISDFLASLMGRQPATGFMPGEQQLAQQNVPPSPNWLTQELGQLSAPASSPSLFGVPLVPLLAGLGGAFLNRSTASKASRNQAMGEGFGVGYGLLNAPIERERAENQRIQDFMINKGLVDPYGLYGGLTGGSFPTTPPVDGLGVPGVAPIGPIGGPIVPMAPNAQLPAGPRDRVMFKYGSTGIPMYATPTPRVRLADLGLDISLPPSMADAPLPMTPELMKLAIASGTDRKALDYLRAHGAPADAPIDIAKTLYQRAQDRADQAAAIKEYGLTGSDVARQMTIKNGVPVVQYSQLPPAQVQALARDATKFRWEGAEYQYNEKQKALLQQEAVKRGFDPNTPAALLAKQIEEDELAQRTAKLQRDLPSGVNTEESHTITNGREAISTTTKSANDAAIEREKLALAHEQFLSAQAQARSEVDKIEVSKLGLAQSGIRSQLAQLGKTIDTLTAPPADLNNPDLAAAKREQERALFKLDAIEERLTKGAPLETPTGKRPDADVRQAMAYADSHKKGLFADRRDFNTIASEPGPVNAAEAAGYQAMMIRGRDILDVLVPQIEAMAASTWGGFGRKDLTNAQISAMRAKMPDGEFDFAYRQWKLGYKPSPRVPAMPTSQVPAVPSN